MLNLFKRNNVDLKSATPNARKTSANLVELCDVTKTFQTSAGAHAATFTALDQVNLTIENRELVAIIGKSGSGKSTLMNMITGIDRPTSGEVFVAGIGIHHYSESRMAFWRGRHLGVVFQFFQLLPTLTLLENVVLPMDFCDVHEPYEREDRAMHLLKLVGMTDHAHKMPAACSGGQQQRTAIARALANDPQIIVADEPTGNLDSKTANEIFDLFIYLVADGRTVLMVTHDNDFAKRVTRAVMVADGRIVDEVVNKKTIYA
jgi:putative ABC transport system ATP-binding protein